MLVTPCICWLGLPFLLEQNTSLGGLNNRNLPHGSTGWKSEIKESAGLFPLEASLLGLCMLLSPCVLTRASLCVCLGPNLFV